MSKKLTIITPTLNSDKYLEETIKSIKPLVDNGAKYYIFDGGSVDGTLEIAKKYGCNVIPSPIPGLYNTLNFAIKNFCKTEFFTYINSDDLISARWISENLNILDKDNNIAAIYGDIKYINSNSKVIGSWKSLKQSSLLNILFRKYMPIHQHGTVIRLNVLNELRSFSEKYQRISDLDLIYRLNKSYKIKYKKGVSGYFRLHNEQFTKQVNDYGKSEITQFRAEHEIKENIFSNFFIAIIYKFIHIDDYIFRAKKLGISKFKLW